jgi:membrane fusion protein (multidrug efflux system)
VAPFSAGRADQPALPALGHAGYHAGWLDEVKVKFSAPERYLADLQRGAVVTVSTTAFPGYPLTGTIDVIEPVLDPVTRSATVTARLRNPEMKFRSGLSADVAVVLSSRPAALAIPSEAIFVEGDLVLTYVVGDSGVVSRSSSKLGTRRLRWSKCLRA